MVASATVCKSLLIVAPADPPRQAALNAAEACAKASVPALIETGLGYAAYAVSVMLLFVFVVVDASEPIMVNGLVLVFPEILDFSAAEKTEIPWPVEPVGMLISLSQT